MLSVSISQRMPRMNTGANEMSAVITGEEKKGRQEWLQNRTNFKEDF